MKIGILSDTHGNLALIKKAGCILARKDKVDRFVHLGDSYQDSRLLATRGVPVAAVPGLYDPELETGSVDEQLVEVCAGLRLLLVHDRKRARPALLHHAQIVLHGHTHHAAIAQEHGRVWCNPGHLKAAMDRGRPPSFALLEIDVDVAMFSIKSMDNTILEQWQFTFKEKGKP
jgi:putative phosphoesterase